MTETFQPGEQIAYIPSHAEGDIDHPDVEFGFVTSQRGDTVFCRYWRRDLTGLRTKANSEGTPVENLVRHVSVSRMRVQGMLDLIGMGTAVKEVK